MMMMKEMSLMMTHTISVDEEMLDLTMRCNALVQNIEGIINDYQVRKDILTDHLTYQGLTNDRLELATQTFELHLVNLRDFYTVCALYLDNAWQEMAKLDADLAMQLYNEYLERNGGSGY